MRYLIILAIVLVVGTIIMARLRKAGKVTTGKNRFWPWNWPWKTAYDNWEKFPQWVRVFAYGVACVTALTVMLHLAFPEYFDKYLWKREYWLVAFAGTFGVALASVLNQASKWTPAAIKVAVGTVVIAVLIAGLSAYATYKKEQKDEANKAQAAAASTTQPVNPAAAAANLTVAEQIALALKTQDEKHKKEMEDLKAQIAASRPVAPAPNIGLVAGSGTSTTTTPTIVPASPTVTIPPATGKPTGIYSTIAEAGKPSELVYTVPQGYTVDDMVGDGKEVAFLFWTKNNVPLKITIFVNNTTTQRLEAIGEPTVCHPPYPIFTKDGNIVPIAFKFDSVDGKPVEVFYKYKMK